MLRPRYDCVLVVDGGPSRRVSANGLVIGRAHDCDIVVPDPRASRRHALVRLTGDGAELVPLGRSAIEIGGASIAKPHALAHGDQVKLPGLALSVELMAVSPDGGPARFVLERANGTSFGVTHTPFVIGGGEHDDLIVKRWPAAVVVLRVAQHELYVEVAAGDATRNGERIAAGALEPLAAGDELEVRGERFRIATPSAQPATTAVTGDHAPLAVTIEILPRGGRLVFALPDGERAVYLADRRFDLLVALLRPPKGYRAGDAIPDDVVRGVVWPRKPSVSRNEINMLISRCRRDLVEAGLAGTRLIERTQGGGATRIVLGPGTEVVVKP